MLGTGTAMFSGEGYIVTPGAIDTHVHLLSPRICDAALSSGITTIVGQDFGPVWNLGTNPAWALARMSAATDAWPLNFAFRGARLVIAARAAAGGACGPARRASRSTRTWARTAPALGTALRVADEHDVQVAVHTDGLNECLSVEDTLDTLAGRTIHAFHIEGCGGGHSPDVLRLAGEPHHLLVDQPDDPVRRQRRGRARPDGLHGARAEAGPFTDDAAIVADRVRAGHDGRRGRAARPRRDRHLSTDSQGMGRVGEVVRRAFQLAAMRAPSAARARPARQRARAAPPREVHDQPGDRPRARATSGRSRRASSPTWSSGSRSASA